jgi:hypothetical protein
MERFRQAKKVAREPQIAEGNPFAAQRLPRSGTLFEVSLRE